MTSNKPIWLLVAPVIFLLLWSGGFSVAKLGISHAEPLSFLSVRYACVCALLAPLVILMRPPLPQKTMVWVHIAIVGFLIQTLATSVLMFGALGRIVYLIATVGI